MNTLKDLKMKSISSYLAILIAFSVSCSGSPENRENASVPETGKTAPIAVDTIALGKDIFQKEVISTGKLRPSKSADIRFGTDGIIGKIHVHNGDMVKKGDTIATLDNSVARLELESASNSLEKAELDLMDMAVGFNYGSDTSALPKELLSVAKIRSGYKDALFRYKKAVIALENTVATAPFDGIIANLSAHVNEKSPEILCRIADPASMEVEFPLLESETDFMRKGTEAIIVPFSSKERKYRGSVTEINPLVDENGQVSLKAAINRPDKNLMQGMSVKVYLKRDIPDCYTVPKSSVVIRDGYHVIFLYDTSTSTASWLYVDILHSNSSEHAISGNTEKGTSLPEKGWIITSGNLNLADGAEVTVRKSNK